MAVVLEEGQWELDGYLFGTGTPVGLLMDGLDYGASERRVQDAERPQGDGLLMGRDYFSPPEWAFTLYVLNAPGVWPVVHELAAVWRADAVRSVPGKLSVLRFCRDGVTYRVLGRPRAFGVQPGNVADPEWQTVAASFQLAAPEYYVEGENGAANALSLTLVRPPSTGGLILPAVLPWRLAPDSAERTGEVTVGGFKPAPFTVEVAGPVAGSITGIKVSGPGWQIATSQRVQYDETLLIDTAANTITLRGNSVAGTLTRASRLSARLTPGHQFISFTASDPTGTAKATVRWFDTVPA